MKTKYVKLFEDYVNRNYILRQSEFIEDDIKRNWSSWNFGQEGLECTEDELNQVIEDCIANDQPLQISGFELWRDELKEATIRELYDNYWVLVDTRQKGLSACELASTNLEDAIQEVEHTKINFSSEEMYDCKNAKIVWSNEEENLHILELGNH